MTTLLYTAAYSAYDSPVPPIGQTIDCRYRCFDETTAPLPFDGRLAGRFWKCFPPPGYDAYIWLDGNIAVTSPTCAADILDALGGGTLGLWGHASRTSVTEESALCATLPKYADVPDDDFGDAGGLWELHCVVSRNHPTARRVLAELWRRTVLGSRPGPAGTVNDQLLLPAVLADLVVDPVRMPGNVWVTPWWHSDSSHIGATEERP